MRRVNGSRLTYSKMSAYAFVKPREGGRFVKCGAVPCVGVDTTTMSSSSAGPLEQEFCLPSEQHASPSRTGVPTTTSHRGGVAAPVAVKIECDDLLEGACDELLWRATPPAMGSGQVAVGEPLSASCALSMPAIAPSGARPWVHPHAADSELRLRVKVEAVSQCSASCALTPAVSRIVGQEASCRDSGGTTCLDDWTVDVQEQGYTYTIEELGLSEIDRLDAEW